MKFLLSWLKEFIELSLHPEALAERLTMAGCEVTSMNRVDGDWRFEVEVTPNRPDLLSHLGIARESAAALGRRFRVPRWLQRECVFPRDEERRSDAIAIRIEDLEGCRRYVGILVEGIQVAPSPPAFVQRLARLGVRPVNNVVDATNLCLLELGQPLHAFDADTLQGKEIRVRRAGPKETLVTIDGETRRLTPELLVIADAKRPVALAGVMGGRDTEITSKTRNVFLESAWFDPARIRRATRTTRLSSESSYRFERGIDPAMVPLAAIRAARMICQLAGGRMVSGILDRGETRIQQRTILLRTRRVREILGVQIYPPQQKRLLERIGCQVSGVSRSFRVKPPSWRADLKVCEDLIEELARLWGYERGPSTLPPMARCEGISRWQTRQDPRIDLEQQIRDILVGAGLQEIMTYSLVHPEDHARARWQMTGILELENPLSLEYSVLRKTLLIGALQTVARNLNRKAAESFRLFELGRIYREKISTGGFESDQPKTLSLLLAGTPPSLWGNRPAPLGFFHLKGVVQLLCQRLSIGRLSESVEPGSSCWTGPAITFRLADELLGRVGIVDPAVAAAFDLPPELPIAYAELEVERLVATPPIPLEVRPVPKVPAVVRDLAIVIAEEIPYESVRAVIEEAGDPLLKEMLLFDLYRGPQVAPGEKSLGLRLHFSTQETTLTDEEVAAALQKIVGHLKQNFQATLR